MIARRTFNQIRKILLRELAKGQRSINELARATGLNWRTTENHLIFLIGYGYVIKTVDCPYVKIFKLADSAKKLRLDKLL